MALNEALIRLGAKKFPRIIKKIRNGEIRVVASTVATANQTDDHGFPAPETVNRTYKYIPCVWEVNTQNTQDANEQNVAGQTRGVVKYRLIVPLKWEDRDVDVHTDDLIELKQVLGHNQSWITLKVVTPVNVSNVHWQITAIDTNSP